MLYEGVLRKMRTTIGPPVQYYLVFDNDFMHLNQALDSSAACAAP